jgi:hypothetical protein
MLRPPRPTIIRTAILLFPITILTSCDRASEIESGDKTDDDRSDLNELLSVPYIASTPIEEGAVDGVIKYDPNLTCPGYRLYTISYLSRAELIDENGNVVHSWQFEPYERWEQADLLENGDVLIVGSRNRPDGPRLSGKDRYAARLTWNGDIVWKHDIRIHHDIEMTPDGKVLALSYRRRDYPQISKSIDFKDDELVLMDPNNGEVITTRSLIDIVTRSPEYGPLRRVHPNRISGAPWMDFFHSNSIEWMNQPHLFGTHPLYAEDHVIISLRNQFRVVIYDWSEDKFIWSWGLDQLHAAHDARLLDNGNITLFDNRVGPDWSRVIEVDPRKGEIVWEYIGDPPNSFYSKARGSAMRLRNGNTLISQSETGRIFEVTYDGEIVWDFVSPYLSKLKEESERHAIARAVWYSREQIDGLLKKYAN